MNLQQIDDRLGFVLDANDTQTDQDFSAARRKQAINWAYSNEVMSAQLEGGKDYFRTTRNETWAASAVTFSLPVAIRGNAIIRIMDITDSNPGVQLVFDDKGYSGDVFWKDRNTLQWGTSGPSSAKTLQFVFYANPTDLVNNEDVPDLIPEPFHDLLVWSAAILLYEIVEQRAPDAWLRNRNESQQDFWKWISRGRPMSDVVTIQNTYPDSGSEFIY